MGCHVDVETGSTHHKVGMLEPSFLLFGMVTSQLKPGSSFLLASVSQLRSFASQSGGSAYPELTSFTVLTDSHQGFFPSSV